MDTVEVPIVTKPKGYISAFNYFEISELQKSAVGKSNSKVPSCCAEFLKKNRTSMTSNIILLGVSQNSIASAMSVKNGRCFPPSKRPSSKKQEIETKLGI